MKIILCSLAWIVALVVTSSGQTMLTHARDPIPTEVEQTYLKGLKYLVINQNAQGYWGDQQFGREPGVVGLAVLAMLAHGDDPNHGPYKDNIRRGLRYILQCTDAKTGQIAYLQTQTMYSHGFATLALAEAYGVVDEPALGLALQRSVDFILACQKRNPLGAWRYKADDTTADTTIAGAQMVALMAARNAGIEVPDEAIEKGLKFYLKCQTNDGGLGYDKATSPNNTRTGIGMLVFTLARQKDTKFYRSAASYFRATITQIGHPYYHQYYASQAAFHLDDATWQAWNGANIAQLSQTQGRDGSWSAGGYGPALNTSMALLSLALNYRYLPIYER